MGGGSVPAGRLGNKSRLESGMGVDNFALVIEGIDRGLVVNALLAMAVNDNFAPPNAEMTSAKT